VGVHNANEPSEVAGDNNNMIMATPLRRGRLSDSRGGGGGVDVIGRSIIHTKLIFKDTETFRSVTRRDISRVRVKILLLLLLLLLLRHANVS